MNYNNGILVGKFLPLHRGHLTHIFNSYTQCDKLHVIICNNKKLDVELCLKSNIKYISPELRYRWLTAELNGFDNIRIYIMDEPDDLPEYPKGWPEWGRCLKEFIYDNCVKDANEKITFFTGELDDIGGYRTHFPSSEVNYFDYSMSRYPISATKIRQQPLKYWDYICGSARKHFAKKILITGTESTGKTTLTKMLAKVFHTSWSEEMGRIYTENNVKDERYITDEDYLNIIRLQVEANDHALKTCNRICFFDTDIVVTYYYYMLYKKEKGITSISNEERKLFDSVYNSHYKDLYDYKFFLISKDVPWVDDGLRRHQFDRDKLDVELLNHYSNFKSFYLKFVDGNYNKRFVYMYNLCKKILELEA